MDKRQLHHLYKQIRLIKPWYFLGLALIFGFISLAALRSNNQHMLKLRGAVYTADQNGQGVTQALQNLQEYVTGHMNTNLNTGNSTVYPPIQLKYTYDRLVKAESDQIAQQNQSQYNDAVAHCPSSGNSYQEHLDQQNCVLGYLQNEHNITLPPIPDALYKFDFVSPTWSPDLAGWSLVATALFALLFVVSLVSGTWLKHATK